jgi:flagellar biosynthetic protein FliQ
MCAEASVSEADVGAVLRDAMTVALKLGGPPLLAMLGIGAVISVFQAATQISETSLAFVPKLVGLCVALMLLGSFMMATLADFAALLLDRLVAVGGT